MAASSWPSVPHLSGIFLNLSPTTAAWTKEQWVIDFTSMKDVGIKFFCLHHPATGINDTTSGCPFGRYRTNFPPLALPVACYEQDIGPAGYALQTMLDALEEVGGLSMHVGLAFTKNAGFALAHGFEVYTSLQTEVATGIWATVPPAQRYLIGGVYAMVEPHNGHFPWDAELPHLASYLQSLATHVKTNMRKDLLVWDAPYATGNVTGNESKRQGSVMNVSSTASWYKQLWKLAPSLDTVAIQDHVGQGYPSSFQNVSEYVTAIAKTNYAAGRNGLWTDVELFGQHTGTNGTGSYVCHVCVAHWERVKAQLAIEASLPHVTTLVAWEWTGCLSPNYGPSGANTSSALYAQYKAYIDAGAGAL
jgi:hypothetical protein